MDVALWCCKWDSICPSDVGYQEHYDANDKKKVNKQEGEWGGLQQETRKVEEEEGEHKEKRNKINI